MPRRARRRTERRSRRAAADRAAPSARQSTTRRSVLEAAGPVPRGPVAVRRRGPRRLGRAGYRPELVDGAIARLTELGMLDDEAFARAWVESRDRARPRGEIALRRELALKGVDRAVVDELLDERRDAPRRRTRGRRRRRPRGGSPAARPQRARARAGRGSAPASPARVRAPRAERVRPGDLSRRPPPTALEADADARRTRRPRTSSGSTASCLTATSAR